MSRPIRTRWIVRDELPPSAGLEEIRRRIARLAADKLRSDEAALIEVADCFEISGGHAAGGRRKVMFLLRSPEHAAETLGRFVRSLDLESEQDWQFFFPEDDPSQQSVCGPMALPNGNPGAMHEHVAVIGNHAVKSIAGAQALRCFNVSPEGVKEIAGAPASDGIHASHMAAIMAGPAGPAFGAQLWSYRLDAPNGAWEMRKALLDIIDRGRVRVVCMATKAEDDVPGNGVDDVALLHDLIRTMSVDPSRPIVFVAAGGIPMSAPAFAPNAISVGAIQGFQVPPAMPPESPVPTVFARGRTCTGANECVDWSPSFAAPHVAGCIATWFTLVGDLTHEEIVGILDRSSEKVEGLNTLGVFSGAVALEEVKKIADARRSPGNRPPPTERAPSPLRPH